MKFLAPLKPFLVPALILLCAVGVAVSHTGIPAFAAGAYSMTADNVFYWDVDPSTWSGPTGNCSYVTCNGPSDVGNSCWSSWPISGWRYLCDPSDPSNCGNLIHTEYSCKGPPACVPDTSCAVSTCTTDTCDDGCGNPVRGTKTCSACVPQTGTTCYKSNACDSTSGIYACDGSCSAAEPSPVPSNYGSSCPSAPNSCSMVDNSGTIQCSGSCSSVTPSDSLCAGAADLTAGSVSPSTATAGTAQTFSTSISNSGTASTGGSFTSLLQKANDSGGGGATDVTTFSVPAIAAGASNAPSFSYTFPASDGGTDKYLRVCADKGSAGDVHGSIAESNDGNNCGGWSKVTVAGAGGSAATVSFNGNPLTIPSGGSSNLSWSSTNATSCSSMTGNFITGGATSNAGLSTGPLTTTTTYGIQCTGPGGLSPVQFVTITVTGGVCNDSGPVNLTSTPTRVKSGETATLTWTASNASGACTVSGPGVSKTSTPSACSVADSVTTPPLTTQAIYTLTCPGGQKSQTVVNIIPTVREY